MTEPKRPLLRGLGFGLLFVAPFWVAVGFGFWIFS